MRSIAVLAVFSLVFLLGALSHAQGRCDCSQVERSAACEASVQHRQSVVAVSSTSPACSMVVWTADGQPNVSLVMDGLTIADWYGSSAPDIRVESCEICRDRQLGIGGADAALDVSAIRPETGIDFAPGSQAPAQPGQGVKTRGATVAAAPVPAAPCPGGSPAPELLVPAALEYPAAMERYALEGTCNVVFDIAESGAAVNIRPTCSHDGFVKEAARAVAVVRFTPPYHCGVPVVRKDVTYPLVFSYNRNRAAIPTMAPIPDRP